MSLLAERVDVMQATVSSRLESLPRYRFIKQWRRSGDYRLIPQ